jgi:ribosomal protein S18 acetylase RimI-like enzyme
MHLRRLAADDSAAFQALRLLGLRESPASFGSSFEEECNRTNEQVATLIAGSDERIFFGAFIEGDLIGVVGVGREGGMKERYRAFIRSMYVAPEARRSGVARSLMEAALEKTHSWHGVEQVTLAVTASNEPAVQLYRSLGFIEYGLAPRALRIGTEYFDELQMVHHQGTIAEAE